MVGGSPARNMPNIDMHHFEMPKIKINNAEARQLMTDSVKSIENKRLSLPLTQNPADFRAEFGAWSPQMQDQ